MWKAPVGLFVPGLCLAILGTTEAGSAKRVPHLNI